jgi:hypothetical protein
LVHLDDGWVIVKLLENSVGVVLGGSALADIGEGDIVHISNA